MPGPVPVLDFTQLGHGPMISGEDGKRRKELLMGDCTCTRTRRQIRPFSVSCTHARVSVYPVGTKGRARKWEERERGKVVQSVILNPDRRYLIWRSRI